MIGPPDWSSLPIEIWSLVLDKLPVEDFICCRSVCMAWFSLVGEPFPWLMLPPEKFDDPSDPWRLLDIASNKMHKIHLPQLRQWDSLILASSDGWLFVHDFRIDKLRLFNPFTRSQILLPSLDAYIYQAYMFISSDGGFTLAVDKGNGDTMIFRKEDEAWTEIQFPKPRRSDWKGTFCKGQFYGLDNQGRVLAFDFHGSRRDPLPLAMKVPPLPTDIADLAEYLVAVPGSDELLLIQLCTTSDRSKFLKLFRLDDEQIVEVTNLDGHCYFLIEGDCGPSYNITNITPTRGLIKQNCVYIAGQKSRTLNLFDIKVQSVSRIDGLRDRFWGQPVWVTPVLVTL